MQIIPASYDILHTTPDPLKLIEIAGRTCYKSEKKITETSAPDFVKKVIGLGHHSVLEHGMMTVRFIVDRGVSHEIVRHRLASYSQESTRYCNYHKAKFGEEITFVDLRPYLPGRVARGAWLEALTTAEEEYFALIAQGYKAQIARSVLPNSLKTEVVMSANWREWRHFFSLRAAKLAHPQMREVACPLLREMRANIPVLFDDVGDPDCEESYV